MQFPFYHLKKIISILIFFLIFIIFLFHIIFPEKNVAFKKLLFLYYLSNEKFVAKQKKKPQK